MSAEGMFRCNSQRCIWCFIGLRIISKLYLKHCHFIDVPLTLEDPLEFQAHKIVLSLVSDNGFFDWQHRGQAQKEQHSRRAAKH